MAPKLSVLSDSFSAMSPRLSEVAVDAAEPDALAAFWSELLSWHRRATTVTAPEDDGCELSLVVTGPPAEKVAKGRVHLDLASESPDHQMSLVAAALSLGASRADIGQRNVPWVVLTDPAGNEFCVLESRPEYALAGSLAAVVVDALDQVALAEFWSAATGWPLVGVTNASASLRAPNGRGPWLEFIRTAEPHTSRNRLRLGLTDEDPMALAARLVALGADKLAVGDGYVELTDPEGNEFRISR
jgi:hypothetical protein